jgi:Glycosyl hydrolases family 16/Bacterial Ig domain
MNRYLALVGLLALLMSGTAAAAQPATSVSQSIRDGTTLSGSITWTATPAPSRRVSSVHFFIDGVDKWTDQRRPYQFNGDPNGKLDTTTLSNGTHTFRVNASWSRGATASNTVTGTVNTAASPPPPPAQCADGIDNDADGKIDYPTDPGCSSASDNDETDAPPPGEPAPIAGQGYHKVFGDEFNTLDRSVWDDHIWYDGPPSPSWTNFQTTHNGELDLLTSRNFTPSYPINNVTTYTSGKTWTFGYFEARMRWTGAPGAWPAFWLISKGWADRANCATPSSEIDMMEGQGSEPFSFYGTIHSDSASACSGHKQNGNNWDPWPTRLADNWHTYAATWTQGQVCWYVDDTLAHCAPTYPDTAISPMFMILYMWTGGWTTDPTSATPDVLHTEVDWVHVWQK